MLDVLQALFYLSVLELVVIILFFSEGKWKPKEESSQHPKTT